MDIITSNWNFRMVRTYLARPLLLIDPKACPSCDRTHLKTTPGGIICSRGHIWFNCDCGSTLTVKNSITTWKGYSI